MADIVDHGQLAAGQVPVQVLSHLARGDQIVAALQDQRRHGGLGQIRAVVGGEGHPAEVPGDLRIVALEPVPQFI